jgi:hypothetical protein
MSNVCLYASSSDSCKSLKSFNPYSNTFSYSLSRLKRSRSLFLLGTFVISLDLSLKKSGRDFCFWVASDASSKFTAGALIKWYYRGGGRLQLFRTFETNYYFSPWVISMNNFFRFYINSILLKNYVFLTIQIKKWERP